MQDDFRVSIAPSKARKPTPLYVEDLKRFKGFARKLAVRSPGNKGGVLLEWASSVTDLHRVLDVTRSLYLINQSHNEILLRVGLELATSKIARKVFQWTDGDWYADEVRREWFRDVVQTNLTHVLETCAGEKGDDEKLAAANLKVKEVKAELASAVQKCEAAEALVEQRQNRVQELERLFQVKSEDLVQTQQQLNEAQLKLQEARSNISSIEAKLRDTRKAASAVEAQLRDANARCLGLEDDLIKQKAEQGSAGGKVQAIALRSSPPDDFKGTPVSSPKRATGGQNEVVTGLKAELTTWICAAETAKSQAAELRTMVSQLESQVSVLQAEAGLAENSGLKIAELEEALLSLNAKIESLTQENSKLHSQLNVALEAAGLAPLQADSTTAETSRVLPATGYRKEQEAHLGAPVISNVTVPAADASAHRCDDQEVANLTTALERSKDALRNLESENSQLRSALDGLHANLKTVISSYKDTGVAMKVATLINNDGLKSEFKGAGVCAVWDRLYADAMERIDRMEQRRDCFNSPQRSLLSARKSLTDDEFDNQTKSWPCQMFAHIDPDVPDMDFSPCKESVLSADLPSVTFPSTAKSWTLPPCSASRQVRCASAHRLRASRQASRSRAATSYGMTRQSEDPSAALLTFCSTGSPSRSPSKNQLNASVSLPSLHGHRLPSWQGS